MLGMKKEKERKVESMLFGDSLVIPEKELSNISSPKKLGRGFGFIAALFMEDRK